ncbi:magnesium transporter [Paracoccaceae bacterium GXU_MW_L88]
MSEMDLADVIEDADAYELKAATVAAIWEAVENEDRDRLLALLDGEHAADIADLLEQWNQENRLKLLTLWGEDLDGDVLSELEEGARDQILQDLPPELLSAAVKDLETDDVVYLIADMEDADKAHVLDALDAADRVAVEQSLTYPEETAGRMMQRELVLAPPHWTVGDTIDALRANDDLPDEFYSVYIVDERMRPLGSVKLGQIMARPRDAKLVDLMDEDFRTIPVDQRQEDVAYAFNQYHMVTAPVVDEDGRLIGVITIDDAMEVLEDEAEEDMMRLAGVGDEEISDSIWETTRLRFPWLAVNLITAIVASLVISMFESTLQAIVALAVLMPIVASMGGNAGTQSLTVAVRGLATRDLTGTNAWRVIRREGIVGLLNGAAFAIIIGIIGTIWFGMPMLGVVLAVAMVINLFVAGLAGILIPIVLDKFGADPALASGTFVTTVTDVVGFFAFLGLAGVLLL